MRIFETRNLFKGLITAVLSHPKLRRQSVAVQVGDLERQRR
jgi:hypothetical protein